MTAAIGSTDPEAAVPFCPGWTTRDLVVHLLAVHEWARLALDSDTPPPYVESDPGDDLGEAYLDTSQRLLARLREVPPTHPCWTFDRANRTAAFWLRRQLHEVAVHRWDLAPYALEEHLAEDGIDEVISFLAPRQVATGRTSLPTGGLRLVTADRAWTLGEQPFTTVSGDASDLLLRLWGRGTALPDGWTCLTP